MLGLVAGKFAHMQMNQKAVTLKQLDAHNIGQRRVEHAEIIPYRFGSSTLILEGIARQHIESTGTRICIAWRKLRAVASYERVTSGALSQVN